MKSLHTAIIRFGLVALSALAVSTGPSLAKCVKIDPIFGMKTYVDDKYCAKKRITKKTRTAAIKRRKSMRKKSVSAKHKTLSKKPMRMAAADKEIREMQKLLAQVGYDPGPADGHNGPKTRNASKAFKESVGLRIGTDTEEVIEVLKRISGK